MTNKSEARGKPQRIRFRKGDVVEIPPSAVAVPVEFTTHNGCRVVTLPKSAGAKVRKACKSDGTTV